MRGTTLANRTLDIRDYKGSVVVLNVWGSWCRPCRKQEPTLNAASKLLGQGVAFVGLDVKDPSVANARAYQRQFDMRYPSIFDPTGSLLKAFKTTLPVRALPTTVVFDKRGRVAARFLGPVLNQQAVFDIARQVMAE